MLTMTYHPLRPNQAFLYSVTLTAMLLGACSWIPKGEAQFDVGIKDRGVASWYGEQFHGRPAANGEVFDMEALTAAHRTMPLGSIVRVVNLENGRRLHVRITDRGPYVNGRILDLSRAAAFQLGMEQGGLAHVQIVIVGQRRPELLQFAETASGGASFLLSAGNSVAHRPKPYVASGLRVLPSDVWLSRRVRRVPALFAGDQSAHGDIPTLTLL